MAEIIKSEKGFKLIRVKNVELICKIGGLGICDRCNSPVSEGVYIAVLNQWFCNECFEKWHERAQYYPEDAYIENRNFTIYKTILGIK